METKSNILIIEDDVLLNDMTKLASDSTWLLRNFCLFGK